MRRWRTFPRVRGKQLRGDLQIRILNVRVLEGGSQALMS